MMIKPVIFSRLTLPAVLRTCTFRLPDFFQIVVMLSFLIAFPAVSVASGPVISEINLHRRGNELFFSSTLKDGITREIKELIVSGVPVPFRYFVAVKMKRRGWIDKTVGRITVIKALKYDLLKKVYKTSEIITRKGRIYRGRSGKVVRSFGDRSISGLMGAESWISELSHVFLLDPERLKPSGEYYIQIRADLRTTNLWVPFNYILFFLSFWDVETDWAFSPAFSRNTVIAR